MKKISVMIAIISMVSLTAASVFAASVGTAFTATGAAMAGLKDAGGTAQPLGTLSNKVSIQVTWDTITFAAATRHDSGTKTFGSSSGDTKIFNTEAALDAPSASDATAFTGWTAM